MPHDEQSTRSELGAAPAKSFDPPDLVYATPSVEDASGPVRQLVDAGDPNPFGSATAEELAAVAAADFGTGPELDASEISIGAEALARLITARMRHAEWQADPKSLAVFVISDRAREVGAKLGCICEPIIDNGTKRLAGRLWVAAPTFHSGYWSDLNAQDTAALFAEISDRGAGSLPALIFDPNATDLELRFYPYGLKDPDHVQRFVLAEHTFSIEALDRVLARFYETSIITPDSVIGDQDPWTSAERYRPRRRAEAFLQGWLKSVLNVAFENFVIDFEIPGTEGRCDLAVTSRHPSQQNGWICHAVLELKVLRSFDASGNQISTAVRVSAVADGLLQAIAYKGQRSANLGMLCCFDMRHPRHCDGDACFDPIRDNAQEQQIQLRRYRLYGSSADLRAEKYGG